MKKSEKAKLAAELLHEMVIQADEDTPQEDRTRHFDDTMSDAKDFLDEHYDFEKFTSDSSDDYPKYSDNIKND